MANRFLYQGAHPAFTRNTGTVAASTTGRNATYTDCSLWTATSTHYAIMDFTTADGADDYAAAGETLWARTDFQYSGGSSVCTPLALINDADQDLIRARVTSSTTLQLQYNSGTLAVPVWSQLGADVTVAGSTLYKLDVRLDIDPAGTAHGYALYLNNVEKLSGTFAMALLTRVDATKAGYPGGNLYVSQILATVGINTIGSFVPAIKASAAGSNSGMTGAYTDVNEVTLSDATMVSSNVAGQRTTFAMGDLPALPVGMNVGAEVRHTFRANNDGVAPTNIRPVIRQAGVDSVAAAVPGLGLGYATFMKGYALSYAEINAAGFELGWESEA